MSSRNSAGLGQSEWEAKVREELADSLTPRGIEQWFDARNRLLAGDRPRSVIARGDGERAYEAACAFAEGVYV